jgi:uncharacterized protein YbaP (TraB family)
MSKLFKSLAALALLMTGSVAAQTTVPESTPALFKVSDADTVIYLFPATSAVPAGMNWFRGPVRAAFESAEQLAIEVDTPTDSDATLAKMRELGAYSAEQPLRQVLTPQAGTKLNAVLHDLNYPAAMFDKMEPWLAASVIGALCYQEAAPTTENSPFNLLRRESHRREFEIMALETVEDQLTRLDTMGAADQLAFLNYNIENCDKAKAQFAEMSALWAKGDLDGLDRAMRADPVMARIVPLVADYRNSLWADWIAQRLEQPGTVFLISSAANFAGPASVQAELEKRGISAARIQ